jgi:hypothetical protein
MAEATWDQTVRPGSVQERMIGGQQALACILEAKEMKDPYYYVWARTESTAVEFWVGGINSMERFSAIFRWQLDPVLATVRIP